MKWCSRCMMPETNESIVIDDSGVCSVCKNIEYKHSEVDWDERGRLLDEEIEKVRGKYLYDAIVPFSGGKDSTFTLWYLAKVKKLKVLVIRFDHGFFRPQVEENAHRAFRTLGCDVHQFTPNWQVVRKLMFESLRRRGDFCWHCHTGIFAYPMWAALRFDSPLLVWGEGGQEYSSWYGFDEEEESDERRFNLKVNLGINASDMVGMLDDTVSDYKVEERDLWPYTFPPARELKRKGVRSIFLGRYIPWDTKKNVEIIKQELGWKGEQVEGVPPQYDYEKIECYMQGVRDYIRYLKRGYGRTAHVTSIDIRNGRMDRDEAEKLVEQYDGKRPFALDLFLDILGVSEEKFHEIIKPHAVAPWDMPDCGECQRCNTVPDDIASWSRVTGDVERDRARDAADAE
jgi:N-acetyl sugar amidotransferase